MTRELPMAITITRVSSSHEPDYVSIVITDVASGARFANVKMGLEDFARALLNIGHIPCVVTTWPGAPIGKRREHKEETIAMPPDAVFNETVAKNRVRAVVRSFEVDGWAAVDPMDAFNGNRITWVNNERFARIRFQRFVDQEEHA